LALLALCFEKIEGHNRDESDVVAGTDAASANEVVVAAAHRVKACCLQSLTNLIDQQKVRSINICIA
jgi:hypothetical protein